MSAGKSTKHKFNYYFFSLRFAIIPIHNKSQKRYIGRNLLGMDLLKERHLQMLGYRVVLITQKAWNSMYMNLPGAKDAFLKDMIDHS